MDAESRVMLDTILSKPIGQMTETEKAVVRARRSYLTEAQCEDLAEVLEEVTEEGDEDGVDLEKLKKDELSALCVEKGIEVPEKATKADLIALLEAEEEGDEE